MKTKVSVAGNTVHKVCELRLTCPSHFNCSRCIADDVSELFGIELDIVAQSVNINFNYPIEIMIDDSDLTLLMLKL